MILMKKKTADAEGNDDIEEAFRVFDTKNDGYVYYNKEDYSPYSLLACRVICAEELMSVMVSLGNPRTEEEIKVDNQHIPLSLSSPSFFIFPPICLMLGAWAKVKTILYEDTYKGLCNILLQAMIAEEDKDGDGVITKEEFMQMLQRKI